MMFQSVAEFHRAFGQLVADHPALPEAAIRTLRQKLLAEEVGEFIEAEADDDLVEIADALADIAYIIAGTAVSYGITPSEPVTLPVVPGPAKLSDCAITRNTLTTGLRVLFDDYMDAEARDDLIAIRSTLMVLLSFVWTVATAYGIPLAKVFTEVHRSNMSKLDPDTGKPIYRADGKVLKGSAFFRPDIAAILAAAVDAPPSGA